MAIYVNTNASSINAQRQLMNSGNALDTSFKRLSSGFRINSAADDAAGLQISNRLTSQINGLSQAQRNANDGISLAQTAEGSLEETTSMLQRMRTLAVQSSNDSNTDSDRLALQQEADQLRSEINRIADQTTFGGVNLLDGTYSARFQVGADGGQTISFSMSSITTNSGGQVAINANGGFRMSGIAGAASAVTTLTGLGSSVSTTTLSLTSIANAHNLISAIDAMIAVVDAKRSELGALQNRFSSTIRNLANVEENVTAARARVRDTDFATETAELTRNQILQQASSSILAQANQRPQVALSLLG
ncbi:flagellin [Maribrevibacterium harenarium]|uniref:Flagellin n=1 Tax=Maribrevibacterium harenarium TaxID=2589817 RepID=A0A501X3B7_9GAMM|nr:flagellin [Maribrevibacterium harenarium]TPE54917.1 flagellin [Maribrevibacterium harenarium]